MMDDRSIGRSEPLIRAPGSIDRSGSATDREKRRSAQDHQQPRRDDLKDRRAQDAVNQWRRRLLDLLFVEVEGIANIEPPQKERLKRNLRAHVFGRGPPDDGRQPTLEDIQAVLTASENPDDHPDLSVDPESLAAAALPPESSRTSDDAQDNVALAQQFRRCMEVNTDAARKVALYLHLLLRLRGVFDPHVVVEV